MPNKPYDAIIVISFGGPEGMDDVIPFLENVLRGRNVPRARLEEVAHHYELFHGVSPINAQNRALIAALETQLKVEGLNLPVYWGNRNWTPYLTDTVRQMKADGVKRALAFVTSAYSSYSSCRQYIEDIDHACEEVGEGAPVIDKLPPFFDQAGFIQPNIENLRAAYRQVPASTPLLFTAHSTPIRMAHNSAYVHQLEETCAKVAAGAGVENYSLVYQSRSGSPHQPWLEPDICATLQGLNGLSDVVVMPIGFISDHMEVMFDLDVEAKQLCDSLGINMIRAATVGTHPAFIGMIVDLIKERQSGAMVHQPCAANCCLP